MGCWQSSSELRSYVHKSLKEIGIKPSKYSGQNFLIDAGIINYQLEQAKISKNDVVLEVGGGIGNLTKCLIGSAKKLYVIEFDRKLYEFLKSKYETYNNIEVIFGDAVKVDWPDFNKCVANLPYQISSPFTFRLLATQFEKAILLYQKEFALRMQAMPGEKNYSRLSVMVQLKAECNYLKTVKPRSFYPPPKVESAMVELKPKKTRFEVDEVAFQQFVTKLFNTKNQVVRKVVARICKRSGLITDKSELSGLPHAGRRIYTLTLEELVGVFEYLKKTSLI